MKTIAAAAKMFFRGTAFSDHGRLPRPQGPCRGFSVKSPEMASAPVNRRYVASLPLRTSLRKIAIGGSPGTQGAAADRRREAGRMISEEERERRPARRSCPRLGHEAHGRLQTRVAARGRRKRHVADRAILERPLQSTRPRSSASSSSRRKLVLLRSRQLSWHPSKRAA